MIGGVVVVVPPSPEFSECSDECKYDDIRREKYISEIRKNTRALSLLDATADRDFRMRAFSESHVGEHGSIVEQPQRLKHYYSKKQANLRANELLNETVGNDVQFKATFSPSNLPGDTVDDDSNDVTESVKDLKRTKDKLLERDASLRALALLHKTVGKGVNDEALMTSNPLPKKASSADIRRAMVERYKAQQKAQAGVVEKLPRKQCATAKEMQGLRMPRSQEQLAESSRKVVKSVINGRDPETIAGMKCDFEVEREKRAKDRALRMMKYGRIA